MNGDEVTPGALGRLALHDDPLPVAVAVFAWCDGVADSDRVVAWFRAFADCLLSLADEADDRAPS